MKYLKNLYTGEENMIKIREALIIILSEVM